MWKTQSRNFFQEQSIRQLKMPVKKVVLIRL